MRFGKSIPSKTCEMVDEGKTEDQKYPGGKTITFCDAQYCPYGNMDEMGWEGETYKICNSGGLVQFKGLFGKLEKTATSQ